MKLNRSLIAAAGFAALFASASAAMAAAPENRPSDTMTRDGGTSDLDGHVYQHRLPPYIYGAGEYRRRADVSGYRY